MLIKKFIELSTTCCSKPLVTIAQLVGFNSLRLSISSIVDLVRSILGSGKVVTADALIIISLLRAKGCVKALVDEIISQVRLELDVN
jgi:hypothetical protein